MDWSSCSSCFRKVSWNENEKKIPLDLQGKIDRDILELTIQNATDVENISKQVDFIFCAVDMPKNEIIELEEAYAKSEVVVVSNNSACRWLYDVPMIVPEINGLKHLNVLPFQRERLGTNYGCIVVKPNCAAQAYMGILDSVRELIKPFSINVALMQAISGSGKNLSEVPEIQGNLLPLIGEAEKSINEPLKIFGGIVDGRIICNTDLFINAVSYRVPVQDGHLANVFIQTTKNIDEGIINHLLVNFDCYNPLEKYELPSSPKKVINYLGDCVYPEPIRDVKNQNGMEFTCGALKYDASSGILQFTGMIHNLVRGAAGGALLTAELMIKLGYIQSLKS